MRPELVVFGGLPGTGKTTLARQAAIAWRAVYLRIDTIEQAILASAAERSTVGPEGYAVACAVARDNLKIGLPVVVDCVNPLTVTREMLRSADIAGHRLPTWEDVLAHNYAPWDPPPFRVDTSGQTSADALGTLLAAAEQWRAAFMN